MNNRHEHLINIDEVRTQMLNDIIAYNERIKEQNEAFIEERQAKFDFVDSVLDIVRLFILFG